MSHVDKTEDHVSKLQREYQDHWNKYAEALERGEENVKVCITVCTCITCIIHVSAHSFVCVCVCVCVCVLFVIAWQPTFLG